MFIDKQSPIPVYYQIKQYILEQIKIGKWERNQALPSERELSELAKVSRMTVRQAINELVNEGVVYRLKGKGTFITQSKIEQRGIMSFSEMVKNKGFTPITQVLSLDTQHTCAEIAHALDLADDTIFYRFKRLRKADSTPVGVEEVFVPKNYCPNLDHYDLTTSLYKILLEHYQFRIEKVNISIQAILANNKELEKLLEIPKPSPLLKVSGSSITHTGMPLFYETSFYRSDHLSYKVSILNRNDY